ncbi:MAG: polysaccharide biosynthesis protein [Bacteroidaceae bacterium]|nr:polysaccharide biosynthesis protein [Bacteroidaceae bacterium]
MRSFDKVLNWYFKRNALPYWIILIGDCVIIFLSAVFVYWMLHRSMYTLTHHIGLINTLLVFLGLCLIPFRLLNTYTGIMRFSSFVDLQRVATANLIAATLCWLAHYPMRDFPETTFAQFSSSQILLIFILATALMWAMRVLAKTLYEATATSAKSRRALIYGVGNGAIALAKSIRSANPRKFSLRGFISPDKCYNSKTMLMGMHVLCDISKLPQLIEEQNIEAVLVSPLRKKEFRDNRELQDIIINANVKIFMAEVQVREDGEEDEEGNNGTTLREVSVEDLLPRDEINVDLDAVGHELTGKHILITGAAGSIGSEIVRQVAGFRPAGMMLIDQAETPEHDIRLMMAKQFPDIEAETIVTSICNATRMERIFNDFRPDYVFHAAAYKHVPMMENNPSEAVRNNIQGTRILADLSVKYGVRKFVMVSTDKAVNPTNVMGCSKRICEIYVQSLDRSLKNNPDGNGKNSKETTQFVTTRFGNVLGSNGSVIPLFREQIKNGGPVTVTDPNIIRYFMLIPEACKLVLEAGTKGNGGEIFVFDMGKPVRIVDLARRMIQLSGCKNVQIKFTGLRAGEKLYEEVLNEAESTKSTTIHEKIRIATVREYDYNDVCSQIDKLIEVAQQYDDMETVRQMKAIVPEFKSNNSKYEVLDEANGGGKNPHHIANVAEIPTSGYSS